MATLQREDYHSRSPSIHQGTRVSHHTRSPINRASHTSTYRSPYQRTSHRSSHQVHHSPIEQRNTTRTTRGPSHHSPSHQVRHTHGAHGAHTSSRVTHHSPINHGRSQNYSSRISGAHHHGGSRVGRGSNVIDVREGPSKFVEERYIGERVVNVTER